MTKNYLRFDEANAQFPGWQLCPSIDVVLGKAQAERLFGNNSYIRRISNSYVNLTPIITGEIKPIATAIERSPRAYGEHANSICITTRVSKDEYDLIAEQAKKNNVHISNWLKSIIKKNI